MYIDILAALTFLAFLCKLCCIKITFSYILQIIGILDHLFLTFLYKRHNYVSFSGKAGFTVNLKRLKIS